MNIDDLKDAIAQNKVQHLCLHQDSKGVVTVKINCGIRRSGDTLLKPDGSPVTFRDRSEAEQTLIDDYGCSEKVFHLCHSPLCHFPLR